jgi:lipoprotein-releasing system permease protein
VNLNLAWYISNKTSGGGSGSFTALIIRICIATTSLSVAVMIIAMGLIYGFKYEISDKIYQFWGHISVTHIDVTQQYAPAPLEFGDLNPERLSAIKSSDVSRKGRHEQPLIRHYQTFILYPGIVKFNETIEGVQLKGCDHSFDSRFLALFVTQGKAPNWAMQKSDEQSREIMISQVTARRLAAAVGDELLVYFIKDRQQIVRKFQIVGIYNTGLEEYDRKIAFIDMSVLQQILGWDKTQISGYELFLHDIGLIDPTVDWLYDEVLSPELLPVSITSRFPAIFEWLELQDYNRVLILFLMVIVCIFNISTTVIVLIIERKNMVGILKALGLPFRQLQMIFVLMSIRILLWALLIGNIAGLGFCFLQDKYRLIKLNEADYYLSYAPVHFVWTEWLILNIGIILLVFIVLLIPAAFIQRIDPVKVIQYR